VVYIAQQLDLPPEVFAQYAWSGRTVAYHRRQIRHALGFRASTEADIADLTTWLRQDVVTHDHRPAHLQEAVYARCRTAQIEPLTPKRIERLVRSALRSYEDQLQHQVLARLGPEGLAQLDRLLAVPEGGEEPDTAEKAV